MFYGKIIVLKNRSFWQPIYCLRQTKIVMTILLWSQSILYLSWSILVKFTIFFKEILSIKMFKMWLRIYTPVINFSLNCLPVCPAGWRPGGDTVSIVYCLVNSCLRPSSSMLLFVVWLNLIGQFYSTYSPLN